METRPDIPARARALAGSAWFTLRLGACAGCFVLALLFLLGAMFFDPKHTREDLH